MANLDKHYDYLLESRCGFEMRNLRRLPIDGVVPPSGVSHTRIQGQKRNTFDLYLKYHKLTLQLMLPPKYPLEPPMARLMSDHNSVLPDHADVNQADGTIEREFAQGEWTPAFTLRDIVIAVMSMLEEARKNSNLAITDCYGSKKVGGAFNHRIELQDWQYEYLKQSCHNFLEKMCNDYACRIRFFDKGKRNGKEYGPYVVIYTDEYGICMAARTTFDKWLAQTTHEYGVLAEELAAQVRMANDFGKREHSLASPGALTERKCGSVSNEGDPVIHVSSIVPAERSCGRPFDEERASVHSENEDEHAESAVTGDAPGADTTDVAAAIGQTEIAVASTAQATIGGEEPSANPAPIKFGNCQYCFRKYQSDEMDKHLELCYMAPMKLHDDEPIKKKPSKPDAAAVRLLTSMTIAQEPSAIGCSVLAAISPVQTTLHQTVLDMCASFDALMTDRLITVSRKLDNLERRVGCVEETTVDRMADIFTAANANFKIRRDQQRRIADLETRLHCQICMMRNRDYVLSCMHLFCMECVEGMRESGICPVCRTPITAARKVFY